MRVVLFGSPPFVAGVLDRLLPSRHEVAALVTRPDMPRGRGQKVEPSPLVQYAASRGVRVIQPPDPHEEAFLAELRALAPRCLCVASYGKILKPVLLELAPLGALNVHASLLPRHRGASPIQAAILAGRGETGVSTMWMDEGLDTGDVILTAKVAIGPDETTGELSARLASEGARLLIETLDAIAANTAPRTPQDAAHASVTKKIRKRDGFLDFAQPAQAVHDRARAMTPSPGATALFEGDPVRVTRTRVVPSAAAIAPAAPGSVLGTGPSGGIVVECGRGAIEVLTLTPAGKAEMDAASWWRGLRLATDAKPKFTTPTTEEPS